MRQPQKLTIHMKTSTHTSTLNCQYGHTLHKTSTSGISIRRTGEKCYLTNHHVKLNANIKGKETKKYLKLGNQNTSFIS